MAAASLRAILARGVASFSDAHTPVRLANGNTKEIGADMHENEKSHSSTTFIPIRINHKAQADLPLPLRELADLLADLAVKQLKQQTNPLGEKGVDD